MINGSVPMPHILSFFWLPPQESNRSRCGLLLFHGGEGVVYFLGTNGFADQLHLKALAGDPRPQAHGRA